MSLLLDALNKADQERKRSDGSPGIDSRHDQFATAIDQKKSMRVYAASAVTLLIILLAIVYWLGRTSQSTTEIATSVAHSTALTDATSRTSLPGNLPNSVAQQNAQTANKTQPPVIASNAPTEGKRDVNETVSDDENITTLYQQNKAGSEPIASTPEPTPTNPVEINNVADATVPPTPPASPSAAPQSIQQFANLPDIQDLPSAVLTKIPSLKYTEHHYHANGGSVVINGTVKHTNDQLAEGLVIDKILEDGMILHIENYSFKMRALNTWVNM